MSENPLFPASRDAAMERLREFSLHAKRYAGGRNFVIEGHGNVSRLSAAIRHRLITEEEVIQIILTDHDFSAVEKFLQEVCWRTYWKGWLAQHPRVWDDAVEKSAEKPCELALRAMNGSSGCEVMDDFTRELRETGYLHNHARMWWAGYWVHHLQLPWAIGADFFMRHLLDADPASNTLSWRWVAGLHTVGKSYLARPDNILRYHPQASTAGLDHLRNTVAHIPQDEADSSLVALPHWTTTFEGNAMRPQCLVIHPEDLSVEKSVLRDLQPQLLIRVAHPYRGGSERQSAWLNEALADAEQRAVSHYGARLIKFADVHEFALWVKENQQYSIFGMAPHVGSFADELFAATAEFAPCFIWLQRDWDRAFFPTAKSGFFSFWKKICRADVFAGRQRQAEFLF